MLLWVDVLAEDHKYDKNLKLPRNDRCKFPKCMQLYDGGTRVALTPEEECLLHLMILQLPDDGDFIQEYKGLWAAFKRQR